MQKTLLQPRHGVLLGFITLVMLTLFALPYRAAALTGSGTAEAPYQIASEADLIEFRNAVNGGQTGLSAQLTQDITLTANWEPIGTREQPYTGTFDGNHYRVTGFQADSQAAISGLFGYSSGTIQNLTVDTGDGYLFFYAGDYNALLCAINRGTIQNCTTRGSISAVGSRVFCGGIAAVNFGTIEDCTNEAGVGAIGADACSGGIAAVSAQGSLQNCINTGGVSTMDDGRDNTELCTGGIVGLNYASTVDRCTNTATVSSISSKGYTGGVTGLNNGVVTDSLNSASVMGQGLQGGVAGYLYTNADTGLTAQVRNTLDVGGNVVYGSNVGGSATNNFYKSGTAGGSVGQMAVSEQQVKSGEVAFLLNGNNITDPVWGQDLSAADSAPAIGSDKVVYALYSNGAVTGYTNNPDETHVHQFDASGKCTVEGCGYESVKLDGMTLTLDGALGVSFYYQIDPRYLADGYSVAAVFTMDGSQTRVPLDKTYTQSSNGKLVYGFRFYVDSDEATHAIAPVLQVTGPEDTAVSLAQEKTYCVYDYLQTIVDNTDGTYPQELVELAKTMATYDYYANEYFGYNKSYTPEIGLLPLDGVTSDLLAPYKQVTETAAAGQVVKHYGSNLYLQEAVFPRYLAACDDAAVNAGNLYMGYRVQGTSQLYTYVPVSTSGSYFTGSAAKRPASELGTTYEIAFFVKDGDAYRQVSPVKRASVYSYIYSSVSNSGIQPKLKQAMQALYLYGQAADAYFSTVNGGQTA